MGGTWSCGGFELLGGGEVDEGGGGGGGGDEAWGVWADVGLLAADRDVFWLTLEFDSGPVRSSPPTLAVMGEWRESFRVRTGEEVRDWMDRGGGEENLRQRRGDLSFVCSPLLLFWFVAKNSSKDLGGGGEMCYQDQRMKGKTVCLPVCLGASQFQQLVLSDSVPVGLNTPCIQNSDSREKLLNSRWGPQGIHSCHIFEHLASVVTQSDLS